MSEWPDDERDEMEDHNLTDPLLFPCTPVKLIDFVDTAPHELAGFDVPVAFRHAVRNSAISRKAEAADWREAARAVADEFFDHDTENKCRDSLDGYSARVMDELQLRKIHGPRGLIDNKRTVQRDALQGDKWWKYKKK